MEGSNIFHSQNSENFMSRFSRVYDSISHTVKKNLSSLIEGSNPLKVPQDNNDISEVTGDIEQYHIGSRSSEELIDQYGEYCSLKKVEGNKYFFILDDRYQVTEVWESDDAKQENFIKINNTHTLDALKGYYFMENNHEIEPQNIHDSLSFLFRGRRIIIEKKGLGEYNISYELSTLGHTQDSIQAGQKYMQGWCQKNRLDILSYYYKNRFNTNIFTYSHTQPILVHQQQEVDNRQAHTEKQDTPQNTSLGLSSFLNAITKFSSLNITATDDDILFGKWNDTFGNMLLGFIKKRESSLQKYNTIKKKLYTLYNTKNTALNYAKKFFHSPDNTNTIKKHSESIQKKSETLIKQGGKTLSIFKTLTKHIVKIAHNMGISLSFNDMPEKNKKTDTFTA
ncbi:hypothetical protein MK079_01995 [Candidatus Gracilibacteria bacterium]|nr:hypothetical protein [Candidatus Gracilibacteria bacterium]